jgi:pantetheine-phosphate adenylyltransferase
MTIRKAVYAGSFDPVTNGHMWMIKEGIKLFDRLVVVIAQNPSKKTCMFSTEKRAQLLTECLNLALSGADRKRVEVHILGNVDYVIAYARKIGATFLLRGIRTVSDFDYERALRLINSDIAKYIQTVFLMPPRSVAEVSSSMVSGLIGPDGWLKTVSKYVPKPVSETLKDIGFFGFIGKEIPSKKFGV